MLTPTNGILQVIHYSELIDGVEDSDHYEEWIDTAGIPYLSLELFSTFDPSVGPTPKDIFYEMWGKNSAGEDTDTEGTRTFASCSGKASAFQIGVHWAQTFWSGPDDIIIHTDFPLPRFVRFKRTGPTVPVFSGAVRLDVYGWQQCVVPTP